MPLYASGLWFAHCVVGGLVLGIILPLLLLFARLHVDPRIRVGNAILRAHKVPVAAVVSPLLAPGGPKKHARGNILLILAGRAAGYRLAITFFNPLEDAV